MTPAERDKLNREIAEMLGWEYGRWFLDCDNAWQSADFAGPDDFRFGGWMSPERNTRPEPGLPDFCSDLNAAQAMGRRLAEMGLECEYTNAVTGAVVGPGRTNWPYLMLQATAEQRAMAAHAVLKARTKC